MERENSRASLVYNQNRRSLPLGAQTFTRIFSQPVFSFIPENFGAMALLVWVTNRPHKESKLLAVHILCISKCHVFVISFFILTGLAATYVHFPSTNPHFPEWTRNTSLIDFIILLQHLDCQLSCSTLKQNGHSGCSCQRKIHLFIKFHLPLHHDISTFHLCKWAFHSSLEKNTRLPFPY